MKFKFLKTIIASSAAVILFSGAVNATLIGNLSYDGTYITGDGYTYLSLDTMEGSTYDEFVTETSVDGEYEDFDIADIAAAYRFTNSVLGYNSSCDVVFNGNGNFNQCGGKDYFTDGSLGNNANGSSDYFLFNNDETGGIGTFWYSRYGLLVNETSYTTKNEYTGNSPFLLYKDTASINSAPSVPEPSTLAIFTLGLMGLALRRFKKKP
jgi:hypothetical protein